ncbi:acetoacetate decarboxylase [Acidocella aminolytica]|jgi:acetoacetate decarboxylase|uniref:Acetoacetate decarboxylase n=1 Tax=Acidocella aminolytica 101 = DSM 11237 TaxID=1120923 RepID=A0A0D6PI95_9PROT|nr:acetoacetate decarboxylase [Acidocella aminolytica]GAN81377.1 acetoacetate decarboxylase [Acidocella aminolytica 101 = DSM 11237]GBQ33560.1 acetoacetate decarboxylase [Acidocella aminolytica 101 = DSM 11237]SHF43264.1 acetoacetate decarboxylase [Acidocella aminolytica 101 = DSM 11237]
MTREEILNATSMPLASPSYPKGPFRFYNREYLLIHYETDPEIIRALLPEPLEPDGNDVFFEWMKMPDSTGFGDYEESGCGISALYNGIPCNYSVMMYLDDEAPTTGGREIWGFPKKYGVPRLKTIHETLTGTLHYDDERVAMGTMTYKTKALDPKAAVAGMGKLSVNLKWIPDVDGSPKVAQLVGYQMQEIDLKFAYEGEARLHLVPHANCRLADLPVRKILRGAHLCADLTLPYGRVLHDYLAEQK